MSVYKFEEYEKWLELDQECQAALAKIQDMRLDSDALIRKGAAVTARLIEATAAAYKKTLVADDGFSETAAGWAASDEAVRWLAKLEGASGITGRVEDGWVEDTRGK